MKAFKVIHQNGLLFNRDSGKRIILREQQEFLISGEDSSFEEKDTLNIAPDPSEILHSAAMEVFVTQKHRDCAIRKVFDEDQLFIFRVGLGKTKTGDQGYEYFFLCRILEDLYSYKRTKDSFPRLCQCHCVVEQCLSKNLRLFEPVFAESLNEVASHTIGHFFSLKRATSLNALIEFKSISSVGEVQANLNSNYISRLPSLKRAVQSIFK